MAAAILSALRAIGCALFGHDYVNPSPDGRLRSCMWCGKERR